MSKMQGHTLPLEIFWKSSEVKKNKDSKESKAEGENLAFIKQRQMYWQLVFPNFRVLCYA